MIKPKKDLTGKVFGNLIVLNFTGYFIQFGHNEAHYNCLCSCGKEKIFRQGYLTGSLKNGSPASCHNIRGGGLKSYISEEEKICEQNESKGINSLLSTYRRNAESRKIDFTLTRQVFKILVTSNCHYCNDSPSQTQHKIYPEFLYNGIDRKNNSIGYIEENCLPCCWICNRAKKNLQYDQFIFWIKKVYNFITTKCD